MKYLCMCLMILCLCGVSFAQEPAAKEVTVPFEDLKVFDEYPDYVYAMPRKVFEKWVGLQNEGAARKAQRLADAWRERNPFRETYVQDTKYKAHVKQSQSERVSETTAKMNGVQDTAYEGTNVQKAYRSNDGYAGGPVLVLNPYVSRPAKIIINDDGVAYVADPDRTLLDWQARRMLNQYLSDEETLNFINQPPFRGSDAATDAGSETP